MPMQPRGIARGGVVEMLVLCAWRCRDGVGGLPDAIAQRRGLALSTVRVSSILLSCSSGSLPSSTDLNAARDREEDPHGELREKIGRGGARGAGRTVPCRRRR